MTYRKKLIEVALPLDAINAGCVEDKERKTRHIRNLHKWFAPMPLAAWRTMLLAAIIDDPAEGNDSQSAAAARRKIFEILSRLASFDAIEDHEALQSAYELLKIQATKAPLPIVVDPFCGGGSTLLEAQRLGLFTAGNDLNPVPVTISRALSQHPHAVRKFLLANQGLGVRPTSKEIKGTTPPWRAEFSNDVRYFAQRIRQLAHVQVGKHYPLGPDGRSVIAWRWTRALPSPDPAFDNKLCPLVGNWWLSKKKAKKVWIEARLSEKAEPTFSIRTDGEPSEPTKSGRVGKCLYSKTPITLNHMREAGAKGHLRHLMMAIVTSGEGGPAYFAPSDVHLDAATSVPPPAWSPDIEMPDNARWFSPPGYGLKRFSDIFTGRQLLALNAFADAIQSVAREIREAVKTKASPELGEQYENAIGTILLLAFGKLAQSNNALVRWYIDARNGSSQALPIFDRQAIPMVWDYVEVNPFGGSVGDWMQQVDTALSALTLLPETAAEGEVTQGDAEASIKDIHRRPILIATDPPYFDNIGYSDLSDFFYFWLRRAGAGLFGTTYTTMLTPKLEELIADPYRHHGSKEDADSFFRNNFFRVFRAACESAGDDYPVLVVYAFKQSEEGESVGPQETSGLATRTGWEAMLDGLLRAGLAVVGTWPIRTSRTARMIGIGTNALASAIVVVCRPRKVLQQPAVSRQEFIRELKAVLPDALAVLRQASIAPVDLAQASIGPGMAIFSRHERVVEAAGNPMSVRSALQLINEALDEALSAQEGEADPDTRFAITWFETNGWDVGNFGDAETLAKARNVSVAGIVDSGILHSVAGKVRLLKRGELSAVWDPRTDDRVPVWEATQHLIRRLEEKGETSAAALHRQLGPLADQAHDLAYRLYSICERKGWAEDARAYNGLVIAWPEISKLAASTSPTALNEVGQIGLGLTGADPPVAKSKRKPANRKPRTAK